MKNMIIVSGTVAALALASTPAFAKKKKPKSEPQKFEVSAQVLQSTLSVEDDNDSEAKMNGSRLQVRYRFDERIVLQAERLSIDGDDTDYGQTSISALFLRENRNAAYFGVGYTTANGEGTYFEYDHSGIHAMLGLHGAGMQGKLAFDAWLRLSVTSNDDDKELDLGLSLAYELTPRLSLSASYILTGLDNFQDDQRCVFGFCSEDESTSIGSAGVGVDFRF